MAGATKAGLLTASAGNMAQGAAWMARHLGVPCSVVVPETAPQAKLERIAGLGAESIPVSFDRWWQTFVDRTYPGMEDRFFVHPFLDTEVMAGNGVIARELAEDLPAGVDAVLVPWGGGGLACGIAAGLRALRPGTAVYAVEVEGAAPLAASLAAGEVVSIDYQPSWSPAATSTAPSSPGSSAAACPDTRAAAASVHQPASCRRQRASWRRRQPQPAVTSRSRWRARESSRARMSSVEL
jgi:threonine dehydratase